MRKKFYPILLIFSFFFISQSLKAQETILSGIITDQASGEALVGVNVAVKGKTIGTVTDNKGRFRLNVKLSPPFTLVVTSVGFTNQEFEITTSRTDFNIQLEEQTIFGKEVVIAASRVEESIMESPVSIEKRNILELRESPASNFYDGLNSIKGVFMSTQSLTFTNPNTRGFNGNTNYRLNQLVDGVDNSPPGLNFAAGNIVGLSNLDVESVELLVGASSALYGPGGLNGTLLMTSKNPFDYQGLSASAQTGLMHLGADYIDSPQGMYDFNLRFAKAFNNKFAFKVNASYLSATDWHAADYRDRVNPASGINRTNPGYDGINVYGDEAIRPVDLGEIAPIVAASTALQLGLTPGTPAYNSEVQRIIGLFPASQVVTRTGYQERELVDYNTQNFKLNTSFHYKINENLEAILQGTYGQGTSVYTAQNRFSLIDFKFYTAKAELKGNNYFIRAYYAQEDAGKTFDAGGLTLRLNETWKPSEQWYTDYIAAFTAARFLGNPLDLAYTFARTQADNRDFNGNVLDPSKPARPLPGSQEFNTLFNSLRDTPLNQGGALVVDLSKVYHFEGMYNFTPFIKFAEVLAGISHRIISLNTEGTTFADTPGNPININQFGAYVQITKKMMGNRLKFTLSGRYDKNELFDGRVTPRGSLVYSIDSKKQHNLRASLQTAFRFPAVADQWVDLDVGAFRVIGGLPFFRNKYNFDDNPVYPLDNPNPLLGRADLSQGPYQFPRFRPERVTAYEIGYKGLLLKERLLIDSYLYYNTYNGFMVTQVLVQNPNTAAEQRYQTNISTDNPVNAYGWAVGLDYRLPKGFVFTSNIAYNALDNLNPNSGVQSRFNSPDYQTNLGLTNRNIYKNIGFSLNWRWQNSFLWEAPFGIGDVPAFHTLDAQVSYKLPKIKSFVKIGGTNLLNNYYFTGFGNPQIGGLYYIALTFDEFLN